MPSCSTRGESADFATGNLIGSLNVGLEGRYAEYVGSVVRPDQEIILVAEPGTELEAKVRLSRIGYDRVIGYVENPYQAFQQHPDLVQMASRLTAGAFEERRRTIPDLQVVDVRNAGEAQEGSVPAASNIPLPTLRDDMEALDPALPTVVFCAGGYRSSIAASLLRHAGFDDVSDILGGYYAWKTAEIRQGKST